MERVLDTDTIRYVDGNVPKFQRYYRSFAEARGKFGRRLYRGLYHREPGKKLIEIPLSVPIGAGLYINYPMCITINKNAVLGRNINLHKGVTIGQENRGPTRAVRRFPTMCGSVLMLPSWEKSTSAHMC